MDKDQQYWKEMADLLLKQRRAQKVYFKPQVKDALVAAVIKAIS